MRILLLLSIIALPGILRLPFPNLTLTRQDDISGSMERGKDVYSNNCVSCHQVNGEGLSGVFPPLANSDHLQKDQEKSIIVLLKGQNEEIHVNGIKYSIPMAAQSNLSDEEIADVLNYIGNSWGNKLNPVTPLQVKSKRD